MNVIAINGEPRESLGKKSSKAIRRAGRIPCVLYGGADPVHFSVEPNDVKDIIYTPAFKLAEITIDGKTDKAILKDVQFHPLTDEVTHIDFLRLVDGQPLKLEVPVRFVGNAPGVKVGGKLQQALRKVKIKTTPAHIVDQVVLDVSKLEMGQSVRIRDIQPQEGVTVMNSPGIPVASVEVPRAMRSATAAEEEAALAGEEAEEEEAAETTEE